MAGTGENVPCIFQKLHILFLYFLSTLRIVKFNFLFEKYCTGLETYNSLALKLCHLVFGEGVCGLLFRVIQIKFVLFIDIFLSSRIVLYFY